MRLPNGFGSVYKLKGNRRNPYMVVLTKGYVRAECNIKREKVILGYYPTKKKALHALADYHENPYDIKTHTITFAELYERWSEDAKVGQATKSKMKSMYNLIYKYALKYDIIEKNYAELCNSVKIERKNNRIPFSKEEIKNLWNHIDQIPFADMILIGIYTGFRPIELVQLKNKNVNLDENFIIGGTKTKAGTNRTVPIRFDIKPLIAKRYNPSNEYLFNDYNMFEHDIVPLTYDKYRGRFKKVMTALDMTHSPHETRHTFITYAKESNINDYLLKKIIGHEIRDVTEKIYTHRTTEELINEANKIIFI